jgi:hypothetical protein
MRGSSRFVALLGMLFAGAGFIMIIFAYDGAATHDVVSSQMPYLISGGFGGLALVVLGVALTVIHVLRQETARLATKLDESTEALAAIAAPRVGPTEVPDGDDTVVASRSTFHRPDCKLVANRDDLQAMSPKAAGSSGLSACRICEPEAAAS